MIRLSLLIIGIILFNCTNTSYVNEKKNDVIEDSIHVLSKIDEKESKPLLSIQEICLPNDSIVFDLIDFLESDKFYDNLNKYKHTSIPKVNKHNFKIIDSILTYRYYNNQLEYYITAEGKRILLKGFIVNKELVKSHNLINNTRINLLKIIGKDTDQRDSIVVCNTESDTFLIFKFKQDSVVNIKILGYSD